MRLATWNVNSIRSRVDRVLAFLERTGTDVLALQETKCKDEQFPREGLQAAGFEVATYGVNQWNGVAIISRVGLEDVVRGFPGQPAFGAEPVVAVRTRSYSSNAASVSMCTNLKTVPWYESPSQYKGNLDSLAASAIVR